MKVAIYCRVSTNDQDCSLQRTELTRYCEARGWKIHALFEEKMTGVTDRRPQLQTLMREARERQFDVVLVWKLDRFARSIKALVTNIQELSDLGIQFISLKDHIDLGTAAGRLQFHVIAAFSEFEAALIKERVIAGLTEAKRKGVRLGRPTEIDRGRVLALLGRGDSLQQVATALGCSKTAVFKIAKDR